MPTQTLTAGDVRFAYRELGLQNGGTPVLLLESSTTKGKRSTHR